MRVLNYGSMGIEYLYHVDQLGSPYSVVTEREENYEGRGLLQSIALSRAGAHIYMAGMVGDMDGMPIIDSCDKNYIDYRYIYKLKAISGHSIVQQDPEGNRSVMHVCGANMMQSRDRINYTLKDFGPEDFLLLQNEINLLDVLIEKGAERGMKIVLNPAPYTDAIAKCDLSKVNYFIMNLEDAQKLTGQETPEEIMAYMKETYPQSVTVLRRGADGLDYQGPEGLFHQRGYYPKQIVDPRSAENTFVAYFIEGLIQNQSMERRLEVIARAEAFTVSHKGESQSIPSAVEVMTVMCMPNRER